MSSLDYRGAVERHSWCGVGIVRFLRPLEASADGLWQAIQVKSALKRNKRESNSYHFAGTGSGPDCDTGIALVCVPQQKLEFLVGNGLSVQYAGGRQYWMTRCDIESVSACNDVGCSRVRENFEHLLFQLPKNHFLTGLEDWQIGPRIVFTSSLYSGFRRGESVSVELLCLGSYTNASNATVLANGFCFDAVASAAKREKGRFVWKGAGVSMANGLTFPLTRVRTMLTYSLSYCIEASFQTSWRVFCFPKRFLMEENIISANYVGGRRELVLYPPGCKAVSHHRQEFARKQCQYFLSFEDTSWTFGAGDHITEKLRSLLMCQ